MKFLATKIVFVVVALSLSSFAFGQTTLRATFGWGDSLRLGWWTPVYVSVMNPEVKPVILEVRGQEGLSTGVVIRQHAVIQPESQTFLVLYPLDAPPSKVIVSVLDEASGKTLAWQQLEDPIHLTNSGMQPHRLLGGGSTFIGISSGNGTAEALRAQWDAAQIAGGFLPPLRLPMDSVGYQAVRVLMLDAVNLRDLNNAQERAILDWVAAGGNLVFWAGSDDLPRQDMILAALPCDIGKNNSVGVKGFPAMNGRELSQRPGAVALPIFSGAATALGSRLGLGLILVLPVDVSVIHWDNAGSAREFWKTILTGMAEFPEPVIPREVPEAEEDLIPTDHPRAQDAGGRQTMALRKLLDSMTGPPVGKHDWGSILLVLGALMFASGPVDSLLLYRVGKAPRTWVTAIGWIGLVAAGCGFAFSRPHSTPPQLQTFSLIDQIDDRTVSRSDVVVIASQHTEACELALDASEWWHPVKPSEHARDPYTDVICREDHDGSRPAKLRLQAGQAAVLRGEKIAAGKNIVTARLSLQDLQGTTHAVGSITNNSDATLSNLRIVTSRGECRIDVTIAVGATIQIDQALVAKAEDSEIFDLTPERTDRIAAIVQSGDFACIIADSSGTFKAIEGVNADKHLELVRALVTLK